jgi:hypothetical protein
MTYQYEIVSDKPAVILTLEKDFNFKTDLEIATPEALDILNQCAEPVFWVVHVLAPMDVEDLLLSTAEVSRGPNAVWRHPMIKEVLLISPQAIVQASAPALSSDMFGNLNVRLFESLDDALAYIRA